MQTDASWGAREVLEDMRRGEPLSKVISKTLQVAKLRADVAEYAWLRLQLIDLDEDKPWNPPPELDTVWERKTRYISTESISLESQGRLLGIVRLLSQGDSVYERIRSRILAYLERAAGTAE